MSQAAKEPAKHSYYFGPGLTDLKQVVTSALKNIEESLFSLADTIDSPNFMSNVDSVIINVLWWIFSYTFWIGAATMTILAGVTFCFFMLIPHIAVFLVVDIIGIAYTGIIFVIELVMMKLRRVSLVCDTCHTRFAYPVYICPSCGAKHQELSPNVFGALHHRCTCGAKLPSSLLVLKNPRRSLDAICPNCWKSGREVTVQGAGSHTVCIPVVGGESAGKSAFITAYVKDLIDHQASAHGLTTHFYDDSKKSMYSAMTMDYQNGTVKKTATVTRTDISSTISFSFYLEGEKLKPRRLMQIYDIAGETFVGNSENEQQRQYEHCDGIVLVIDPMSLPKAQALFGNQMDAGDQSAVSSASLEDVMNALNNDLRENTKIDKSGKLSMPLAVVLNKVDEAEGLDDRFGNKGVMKIRAANTERFTDDFDLMDLLCRQFLVDMDMPEIVDLIEQNFKSSRFFAVSAIGHTAGNGNAFKPLNVNAVMSWILQNCDPNLAKDLSMQTFSKASLPQEKPVAGLYEALLAGQGGSKQSSQ